MYEKVAEKNVGEIDTLTPTTWPNLPKIGAKRKAAKCEIPNTKPYWDGKAPAMKQLMILLILLLLLKN